MLSKIANLCRNGHFPIARRTRICKSYGRTEVKKCSRTQHNTSKAQGFKSICEQIASDFS
jgi:hypothetical protein